MLTRRPHTANRRAAGGLAGAMALLLLSPPAWGDGVPASFVLFTAVIAILFIIALEAVIITAEAAAYRLLLQLDLPLAWRISVIANLVSVLIATPLGAVIVESLWADAIASPLRQEIVALLVVAALNLVIEVLIVVRQARSYPDRRRLVRVAIGINLVTWAAVAVLTIGVLPGVTLLAFIVAALIVVPVAIHALRAGASGSASRGQAGTR